MSTMTAREVPIVFDCEGSDLVGIVHKPETPMSVGIVAVIAGGPQYRAGVGRNMVKMSRELSTLGVAILRFDHRGLGDSGGQFRGFEHTGDDLQCAVDALRAEVPEVGEVILWGGCDAASGCMIHGYKLSGVASMVLGNPWVTTSDTQAAVLRQHYFQRLRERSFWLKLLRFEYPIGDYVRAAFDGMLSRAPVKEPNLAASPSSAADKLAPEKLAVEESSDWVGRMRDGLRRFDGPVLFLMSGQSLVSREFDELVSSDRAWQKVYKRSHYQRIDLPDADQTFSGGDSRERVNEALLNWVVSLSDS